MLVKVLEVDGDAFAQPLKPIILLSWPVEVHTAQIIDKL